MKFTRRRNTTWRKLALSLALLLLLAAGATWWRAAAREADARRAQPPEGRFAVIEGVRIHMVVAGPEDGSVPDLVLIHGASGSGRDFTFDLVQRLAGRYRVIVPDRPGFGWSGEAPGKESLADQARLLAGAAAVVGADRPIVLGHSYGGAVALAWGVTMPDRAAALVPVSAPSYAWEGGLPTFYRITSSRLGQALAVPLIAAWVPEGMIERAVASVFEPQEEPPGYADWFGPRLSASRTTLRVNARERAALKPQLAAMEPLYPALPMPVELVHGMADTTVGVSIHSARLAQAAPQARLKMLPGVGHMAHHAAPDEVIAAIDRAAARAGLR